METETDKIIMPEAVELQIGGIKFQIRPFVLRDRIKVIRVLSDIIKDCNVVDGVSEKEILHAVISVGGERIIEIYEIVLKKEVKWLEENIILKDEFNILKTIVEVNDIPFLLKEIKRLRDQSQVKTA